MLASEFEVIEPASRQLIFAHVTLRRLFSESAWTEGPVYVRAGRYLLFSDLPNDRIMRWDETNGVVSVFRSPAALQTATRSTASVAWSPACTRNVRLCGPIMTA